MFFDGLTIQQKLVKYLLKSTIGKLLNQIQWDKVIIENNTITLNNVQLNYNLFFNALANHSILFKNGIIKSLIVTVPSWSTFFQDGLQISINDLNLILSTCDPINQSIAQIPILSTSFHFADEFIRSEVLESNTPQEPSALSDLAHIIENIIGKAMVSLTNVTIEIQQNTTDQSSEINNQSNEFNNQSNENYDQSSDVQLEALMLNIDKVTICDHVSEQLDIPEPLQLSNNDLLSRVVKYMSLEGMAISHCIPNANVVQLTSIPLSWIRLLFTQENVDFENSQNSDVENNFVFSDINVNIWTKDITCIAHIHDFQNASNFLKTLKKGINVD
ncbi:hypothetical protein BC833DRAFT_139168 [Globomyces pollinis-pini]|nr:hypothetical protein BC833DRAFT_139168 [Globomyces pollinis-pini]